MKVRVDFSQEMCRSCRQTVSRDEIRRCRICGDRICAKCRMDDKHGVVCLPCATFCDMRRDA